MPDSDAKTLDWLREQFEKPHAAYKTAEWAKLSGLPRYKVVRWFVKKGIIKRGDGSHHEVTRDDVQQRWPGFWRSIRRRLSDLLNSPDDDVEDAA